ncbi:MAG: hypothetical protein HY303_14060 [Candidatus Wallbacteria bacterium]|nr:hypothetical protein [Candidatus Wallbacteria bacterium]
MTEQGSTLTNLRYFVPFSSGWEFVWFDFLALLLIACFFDFKKPFRLRNLDLLMLCVWVPLGDYEKGTLRWTAVVGYWPLFYFLPRLLWQPSRRHEDPCVIHAGSTALATATLAALFYGALLTLICPLPYERYYGMHTLGLSASAIGGSQGAAAILKGQIPYGNLPKGWDCYGPAYYYCFAPFVALLSDLPGVGPQYHLPARALTILANFVAASALRALGQRLAGVQFGWALACFWSAIPYTLISCYWSQAGHLLVGALLAVAGLGLSCSTVRGGLALAWASAAAFFPVLLIPVWAARLAKRERVRFVALVVAAGMLLTLPMLCQSQGIWRLLDATLVFRQTRNVGPWSPWTHFPWTRPAMQFFQWMTLPVVAYCAWRARGRGYVSTLALAGAVVIYTQLYSLHAPGRYQLWMLPFLLPVLLLGSNRAAFEEQVVRAAGLPYPRRPGEAETPGTDVRAVAGTSPEEGDT